MFTYPLVDGSLDLQSIRYKVTLMHVDITYP